jgi:hypothetical protein
MSVVLDKKLIRNVFEFRKYIGSFNKKIFVLQSGNFRSVPLSVRLSDFSLKAQIAYTDTEGSRRHNIFISFCRF